MKLLVVLAHPDDESMGAGGLLARHARAEIDVHLVCVTRGGAGWLGKPAGARPEDLPEIRTAELKRAADVLGLAGVEIWDYPDGGVESSDGAEITRRIKERIEALRPAAVVGWGPDGAYGHPDHIAVGKWTDDAVMAIEERDRPALYHLAIDQQLAEYYREVSKLAGQNGDSLPLRVQAKVGPVLSLSPDEVAQKVRAIDCHQSQLEEWRVLVRHHPQLMQKGYGREPYVTVGSAPRPLTAAGLLAEFA